MTISMNTASSSGGRRRPTAMHLTSSIFWACSAASPGWGRARPDLPGRDLRSLAVGRHLVICRIEEGSLRIIRILHSAVDVVRKLVDEPQD